MEKKIEDVKIKQIYLSFNGKTVCANIDMKAPEESINKGMNNIWEFKIEKTGMIVLKLSETELNSFKEIFRDSDLDTTEYPKRIFCFFYLFD